MDPASERLKEGRMFEREGAAAALMGLLIEDVSLEFSSDAAWHVQDECQGGNVKCCLFVQH